VLAGFYAVGWSAATVPSGLYECRLSTDSIQDITFALLHRMGEGPEIEDLGYTSSDGVFETNDSIRFPNTFELPTLTWTDEFDDSLGQFSILDSVTIRLTDTTANLSQYFERKITNGSNSLTLVWDTAQVIGVPPPAAGPSESHSNRRHFLPASFESPITPVSKIPPPTEFILNQNYPNPFN